jgi:hypothetical protein
LRKVSELRGRRGKMNGLGDWEGFVRLKRQNWFQTREWRSKDKPLIQLWDQ